MHATAAAAAAAATAAAVTAAAAAAAAAAALSINEYLRASLARSLEPVNSINRARSKQELKIHAKTARAYARKNCGAN